MPRNLFRPTPTGKLEIGLFVFLALCNVTLLGDALINGPFWYTDYSFYGMQYGERQVFEKINEMLVRSPDIKIKLSPDWANGLPVLARFFLYDPLPIEIESLKGYMNEHREIDPHALFIVPLSDYIGLSESGKFNLRVVESVSDPNGNLAFAFLRAEYVANIDDILAQEAAARHQLRDAFVDYAGKIIAVRHPQLDMGEIRNAFDNNNDTVVRTFEANPLVVEMYLGEVQQVSGIELIIGATLAEVTVSVYSESGATPKVYTQQLEGFLDHPGVSMDFGETVPATIVRIEIRDMRQGEPGHVHLWEVRLR